MKCELSKNDGNLWYRGNRITDYTEVYDVTMSCPRCGKEYTIPAAWPRGQNWRREAFKRVLSMLVCNKCTEDIRAETKAQEAKEREESAAFWKRYQPAPEPCQVQMFANEQNQQEEAQNADQPAPEPCQVQMDF